MKAAIVISEKWVQGRFGELVSESKKSRELRFFTDTGEAEEWLVKN